MPDPYTQHLEAQEKQKLLQAIRALLKQKSEILFAYIFGSFLSELPFHDVDVAVFLNPEHFAAESHSAYGEALADELSSQLKQIVDVVVLNAAPDSFSCGVLQEGEMLFSHHEETLSDFMEKVSLNCIRDESLARQSLEEIAF